MEIFRVFFQGVDIVSHPGEIYALLAAVCWTVTAMSFESAGKKVGSLSVNILRLVIALAFFSAYGALIRGYALPLDAGWFAWKWLGLSALVGFCIGDLCLFRAFVLIGSRISMLVMSAVPPITALIGIVILGETLTPLAWMGMALTVSGISLAVLNRDPKRRKHPNHAPRPVKGLIYALGGAAGQALGLVLSKFGMGDYDAVAATHIRVIVGTIGFCIIFSATRRWPYVVQAIKHRRAMGGILLGSFFGPFLGVSFSLLAVKYTDAGIASTIMAIVPVLIIPPAILVFKERVTFLEILGACAAVTGVALLFL